MITIRKSHDRGFADHGWLKSWHTFSFAEYYDPKFMHFSVLRVINEDKIAENSGFPTHPHRDMEIMTYVLSGVIEHQDSMGNKTQIQAGEFQIMSAGSGIQHSEYNPNTQQPLHLYQIWIIPNEKGIPPRYAQKSFGEGEQTLILSPDAIDGSFKIYQDMRLWRLRLSAGKALPLALTSERKHWLQIVKGKVKIEEETATESDGIAIQECAEVVLTALENTEILWFDLP